MTCVLADDHPPILESVSTYLGRSGIEVVATARTGASAIAAVLEHHPNVAVVDLMLPDISGFELIQKLGAEAPDTHVILYTGLATSSVVSEAMAAGARGVILKDAPLTELLRAVELGAAGRIYIDGALAGSLAGDSDPAARLTDREREILVGLANGLDNEAIGKELFISPETVRTHIRRILAKLGAKTRSQAVAAAMRSGYIR